MELTPENKKLTTKDIEYLILLLAKEKWGHKDVIPPTKGYIEYLTELRGKLTYLQDFMELVA